MTTAMARETEEIPAAAARLLADPRPIAEAAAALSARRPRFAVICGRGSSGHAGLALRYLLETRLRIATSMAAPSVVTLYRAAPAVADAVVIGVSQSGQSPDLVATLAAARDAGALTIAIVNDVASPLAQAGEHVIPICAGEERAVAATKSVVGAMLAGAALIAQAASDDALRDALRAMPVRLARALALDWTPWGHSLASARAAFVVGRGYGLGPAREIALKVAETVRLPALAYSAAELRHGPQAAITRDTPLLALRQADATAADIDALLRELVARDARVFAPGADALPWIGDSHAACDPICMLPPAYRAIEAAARRSGRDPDNPPNLQKVTRTV